MTAGSIVLLFILTSTNFLSAGAKNITLQQYYQMKATGTMKPGCYRLPGVWSFKQIYPHLDRSNHRASAPGYKSERAMKSGNFGNYTPKSSATNARPSSYRYRGEYYPDWDSYLEAKRKAGVRTSKR